MNKEEKFARDVFEFASLIDKAGVTISEATFKLESIMRDFEKTIVLRENIKATYDLLESSIHACKMSNILKNKVFQNKKDTNNE